MNKWNKYLFLLCINCATSLNCMKRKRMGALETRKGNGKRARKSKRGGEISLTRYNKAHYDRVKSEMVDYIGPIFGKDLSLISLVRAAMHGLLITTNREREKSGAELVKEEEFSIDTTSFTNGILKLKDVFFKYYPQYLSEYPNKDTLQIISNTLHHKLHIDDIECIKKNQNLSEKRRCYGRETDGEIRAVMLQCKIFLMERNLCTENETNFWRMIKRLFVYARKLVVENYNLNDKEAQEYKKLWRSQVESNKGALERRKAGVVFIENLLKKHTHYFTKSEQGPYPVDEVYRINHIMEWLKKQEEEAIIKLEEAAIDVLNDSFAQEK